MGHPLIQPIDKLFAGNCDANGNFVSPPIQPAPALYSALKVVAQTTGAAARWNVVVGGTSKAFSPGPQVDVPILVQPNQSVIIQISGAQPNAAVSGTLTGVGGTTFEEVAPFLSLVPNTITLQTLTSEQPIDSFTQPPNVATANRLYRLPAGTQNVRLQVNGNAQLVSFTGLKVLGNGTGNIYVLPSSNPGNTGGFDLWFKPEPADVAAGILFSLDTTGSANAVEVNLTADLAMNFVVASLAGAGTNSGSPLLVENTTPAPWQQAKSSVTMSANFVGGTPQSQIAGVVGQIPYIHDVFIVANAAANVSVRSDSTHVLIAQGSANAAGIALDWDGHGNQKCPAGEGIEVITSVNTGLNGTIGFTQQ